MELTLAILMVFGIFVGIPFVIGFAIGGGYLLHERRIQKAESARAVEKAEEIVREPAKEKEYIKVS